jgi:hypothetical protein
MCYFRVSSTSVCCCFLRGQRGLWQNGCRVDLFLCDTFLCKDNEQKTERCAVETPQADWTWMLSWTVWLLDFNCSLRGKVLFGNHDNRVVWMRPWSNTSGVRLPEGAGVLLIATTVSSGYRGLILTPVRPQCVAGHSPAPDAEVKIYVALPVFPPYINMTTHKKLCCH